MDLGTRGRLIARSAADDAFGGLQATVERLRLHPAWAVFSTAIERVEAEVGDVDLVLEIHQQLADTGSVMLPNETMDHYQRTIDHLYDMDDYCGAFFLVLQTRLAAITSAACDVYRRAKFDDQIEGIALPKKDKFLKLSAQAQHIWAVGNYVKHHDEWSFPLGEHQGSRTMNVLCEIGVAEQVDEPLRYLTDWVATKCARVLAGTDVTADALTILVEVASNFGAAVLDEVRKDFDKHATEVEAKRKAAAHAFAALKIGAPE